MTLWFLILSYFFNLSIFTDLNEKPDGERMEPSPGAWHKKRGRVDRRNVTRMEERMIALQFHDLFKFTM